MSQLLHTKVTEAIIGAAMTVLNVLKPGLEEKVYERALIIELVEKGHVISAQKPFEVYYKGHKVGTLIPDLIVDEVVIVDTKVVTDFDDSHIAQMLGYLNVTGLKVALLVNFKKAQLQWKRVVN
jgi:GxxExxY protein